MVPNALDIQCIKFIRTNIQWSIVYHKNRAVHLLNCYIPPYNDAPTRTLLAYLVHCMYCLFRRDPQASVIVVGDFNQYNSKVESLLAKWQLKPCFPDCVTHISGGKLDQIYTNCKV